MGDDPVLGHYAIEAETLREPPERESQVRSSGLPGSGVNPQLYGKPGPGCQSSVYSET